MTTEPREPHSIGFGCSVVETQIKQLETQLTQRNDLIRELVKALKASQNFIRSKGYWGYQGSYVLEKVKDLGLGEK